MDSQPPIAQPSREMNPARLEGFSDGVLAVIITIMLLGLKPPPGDDLAALRTLIPGLLIYVLSFLFVAEYWVNHHHLFRATRRISSGVMWANLHLLFWLSLVPVVTAWTGAHPRSQWPAVSYGAIVFLAGIAFNILSLVIRTVNQDTHISEMLGQYTKGMVSLALYILGIGLAFIEPLLAYGVYTLVAILWFIPNLRLATDGDTPE